MKQFLQSTLLLFFVWLSCDAQTSPIPINTPIGIVDTIIVIGNSKTDQSVILREMSLNVGNVVTFAAIDFDRNRIYSLGLFNRVDIFFEPIEDMNTLIVDVSERWYIIPLPVFGFREGDPKKAYYGVGLLHNNFRGYNQKLSGSIVFGYNPSLSFFFADPRIDVKRDLFFSTSIGISRIRNKSKLASATTGDFDEFHFDVGATIGKRFTLYDNVGLNLGYRIVHVSEDFPGRTVSPDGSDRFIHGTIYYSYDTRNLRDFTTSGTKIDVSLTKNGFGESDVTQIRLRTDFRHFTLLGYDLTLGTRLQSSTVWGGFVPTYNRSYFGYGEKIRGHFNTVFEGENLLGGSLELRFPILKPTTFRFTAISLPEEFSIWRYGVSLTAFADAGSVWFRSDRLSINDFASGYGGGVVIILPYDVVARAEYAWNNFGIGQFILDLRASF